MTFPPFMSRSPKKQLTNHVARVQKLAAFEFPDNFCFIETDDDIESLVDRAQVTLVEASFVDRCPGFSIDDMIDVLELESQRALDNATSNVVRAARAYAFRHQREIDNGS